jgi:hypothetical protein
MFDVVRFLRDHHIQHTQSGKHARDGWVQVHCPFCTGSRDYHLGISLSGEYGSCWRCKGKSTLSIVQALLGCGWGEAKAVLAKYSDGNRVVRRERCQSPVRVRVRSECKLPTGTGPMGERHKKYLGGRGFDAEWLEQTYGLQGTGPVGEYKHRVIAPIVVDRKVVSFQGRDITGRSSLKYMACPQPLEAMDHKEVLYAVDLVPADRVVVVEGIADAWRLGPGAVATFGTAFKPPQVRMILERFNTIFLLYDRERQAQANAWDMARKLVAAGRQVEVLELASGDPGEMKQDDADALMRELGINY